MCTGTIDPVLLTTAFKSGADGVFVGGCRPGDCHYSEGNYFALWKVRVTQKFLERAGLEAARLDIQLMSSAEGERYVNAMNEFIGKVKSLGPTPLRSAETADEMAFRLDAVQKSLSDFKYRALIGKFRRVSEKENVYGDKIPDENIEKLLDGTIDAEYTRARIMLLVEGKPYSVVQLAEIMGEPADEVLHQLTYLRSKNLLDFTTLEGRSPLYAAL